MQFKERKAARFAQHQASRQINESWDLEDRIKVKNGVRSFEITETESRADSKVSHVLSSRWSVTTESSVIDAGGPGQACLLVHSSSTASMSEGSSIELETKKYHAQ